jgi:DNA polymerase III subunit gamma/tau
MLLSQQASLVRLDEQRAVVRVSGNWMPMVQSRLPLLEQALQIALGSPRQLVLESQQTSQAATQPDGRPAGPKIPAVPLAAPTAQVEPVLIEPSPPSPQPSPPIPSPREPLAEKAQRLAEFFNGEVVDLDEVPVDPLASGG